MQTQRLWWYNHTHMINCFINVLISAIYIYIYRVHKSTCPTCDGTKSVQLLMLAFTQYNTSPSYTRMQESLFYSYYLSDIEDLYTMQEPLCLSNNTKAVMNILQYKTLPCNLYNTKAVLPQNSW